MNLILNLLQQATVSHSMFQMMPHLYTENTYAIFANMDFGLDLRTINTLLIVIRISGLELWEMMMFMIIEI